MPTVVTPNLQQNEVGDFIKSAIDLGNATSVEAEKLGTSWTVTVTRPPRPGLAAKKAAKKAGKKVAKKGAKRRPK
jgi:hypothetical protein